MLSLTLTLSIFDSMSEDGLEGSRIMAQVGFIALFMFSSGTPSALFINFLKKSKTSF
jgi:hypothetical protein